jgi:muramoyltetrapeptide carboxypeptidase
VAPSSPFDLDEFWRGLAWVRDRYRVKATRHVLLRTGYLAGSDAQRGDDLARAMLDPDVKAILVARGGYGAMRVLDALPWDRFRERPSWIVGFSDTTALHLRAAAEQIASVHAPNVTGLGQASPADRATWLAALERPEAPRTLSGVVIVHPGQADGPLVGGNLALVIGFFRSLMRSTSGPWVRVCR